MNSLHTLSSHSNGEFSNLPNARISAFTNLHPGYDLSLTNLF
jgi:hypothetical protein